MQKIAIQKSEIQQKGVFATKPIKKDEVIFKFANRTVTLIPHEYGCNCESCRRIIQETEKNWLYPNRFSPGWFLNHHCESNSGIKVRNIVARKNIKKGEEITIDYSTTNAEKWWWMKCFCDSKKCRDVIRNIYSLPKSLFNKYKGYMPKYVENKYLANQKSKAK